MTTLASNFNSYPKVSDWNKVYFLLQQANSIGFSSATKKEIVTELFGDVTIQGAGYEDLPVSTSSTPVALPIPQTDQKFGFLANGKYSQPNGATLEYSAKQWGLVLFTGGKWTKKFTLELPQVSVAPKVVEGGVEAVSQDGVFKHVSPIYSLYKNDVTYIPYNGNFSPGYIGNTGLYNPNELYTCTDPIPCSEGDIGYYQGQPANNDLPTPAVVGFNGNTFVSVVKNHQFVSNNQFSAFQIPAASGINNYRVSWLKNGNEALKVKSSKYSYKGVSSAAKQLFDKSKEILDITDFNQFGWYNNRYISNVNGALNSANGWKTLNVPLLNYKDQNYITVSHLAVGGNKYYRFVDKDGLVISFGPASSAMFTLAKPNNALAFQMVIKVSSEVDAGYSDLMVNFGDSALPFENFENNPYAIKSIDGNPIIAPNTAPVSKIIDTKKSIAYIGNSITANGVNGSLIGYQLYLNQVFLFTKYTSYGYSGQPFGTFVNPTGVTIIERFIKEATAHDIYVLVCPSTNDFRLGTRLGTFEDYKALTSYGTTSNIVSLNFYQALKAFLIRCYELNPQAKVILSTDTQRDNATWNDGTKDIPYDSRHPNPVGITMNDFATGIRKVAEYESLQVIDFLKEGGFNPWTLPYLTSDKLHQNNLGYKEMATQMEPKIKLVLG